MKQNARRVNALFVRAVKLVVRAGHREGRCPAVGYSPVRSGHWVSFISTGNGRDGRTGRMMKEAGASGGI